MPRVQLDIDVATDPDLAWRTILDVESYAEYMDDVRCVTVLSNEPGQRVTAWSVVLKGSILEWTEVEVILEEPRRINFRQLDGDLDVFDGYWQVSSGDTGCRVTLVIEFEIGIPLLADMLNPVATRALRDNSERMLRALEARSRPPG